MEAPGNVGIPLGPGQRVRVAARSQQCRVECLLVPLGPRSECFQIPPVFAVVPGGQLEKKVAALLERNAAQREGNLTPDRR